MICNVSLIKANWKEAFVNIDSQSRNSIRLPWCPVSAASQCCGHFLGRSLSGVTPLVAVNWLCPRVCSSSGPPGQWRGATCPSWPPAHCPGLVTASHLLLSFLQRREAFLEAKEVQSVPCHLPPPPPCGGGPGLGGSQTGLVFWSSCWPCMGHLSSGSQLCLRVSRCRALLLTGHDSAHPVLPGVSPTLGSQSEQAVLPGARGDTPTLSAAPDQLCSPPLRGFVWEDNTTWKAGP